MEYAQILPRLHLGSHPATIEDIDLLRRSLAVTAVLNLQTDEDMQAVGLDFRPLEAYYRTSPVVLVRVPMMEEQPVMREKLTQCIRALERLLVADQTVFLHCTAGIGRAQPSPSAIFIGGSVGNWTPPSLTSNSFASAHLISTPSASPSKTNLDGRLSTGQPRN